MKHIFFIYLLFHNTTYVFAATDMATRRNFVNNMIQRAFGIINKAAQHRGNSQNDLNNYRKVYSALKNTRILYPEPGTEYSRCGNGDIWAFYHRDSHTIYLCNDLLLNYEGIVPQVLIHEATHAAGQRDECKTTLVEFDIMLTAGYQPYPNKYVRQCGITWSY